MNNIYKMEMKNIHAFLPLPFDPNIAITSPLGAQNKFQM